MTSATLTLADFILQRIAEDETVAREASEAKGDGNWLASRTQVGTVALAVVADTYVPQHIARHDPARVLADLEAKRRIVELHYPVPASDIDWTDCGTCPSSVSGGWPCPTLRILALPYADHPSYREEWRP